jgi:hypothetical protein
LARNEKSSQGKDVTIQIPPAMKEEVASIWVRGGWYIALT